MNGFDDIFMLKSSHMTTINSPRVMDSVKPSGGSIPK
jgi:hypothetical protein